MRISHLCALSAALLACSCSRETPPAPAQAPQAATAAAPSAPPPPATPAPPARDAVFGREQLDQMLAPIALYPDPLLAQVLMAATYPGDVSEAAAWSKAHPDAKGDDAVRQVATQPWDPSVQALVAFPQALATLGQDPAWVQRLGDAFLAQPEDVMDAVQRLRHQAQATGHLESNEYQKVSVEQPAAPASAPAPAMGDVTVQPSSSTIIIEPADPEVVYVPSYDPTVAYGTWAYPSYPPVYYPPSPYYYMGGVLATGFAFGMGVAVADSLWGDCDWDGGDIDIDVDRYNNINTNRQINASQNNWQHNSVNRDGVPYRDRASREQYGRQLDGANGRQQFRGDDPQRARSREQARASMQQRGFDAPARSNAEARDRAREADRTQARDRARDTQRQAQARDTQRAQADRARDSQRQAQTRDRSAGASARTSDRSADRQRQQRSQSNSQARQSARQQQSSSSRTRNNAFEGSRSPSSSRAQQDRGRSSHQSSRSSPSRSSGRQVSRQSQAPQRQSRR